MTGPAVRDEERERERETRGDGLCTEQNVERRKLKQEGEKKKIRGEMIKALILHCHPFSEVNRTDGVFNVTTEEEHGGLVRFLIPIAIASITSDNQMTAQCQKAYIKDLICARPIKASPVKHRVIIQTH